MRWSTGHGTLELRVTEEVAAFASALDAARLGAERGDYAALEALFERFPRAARTSAEAHDLAGTAALARGQLSEGLALLECAARLAPSNSRIQCNFAAALSHARDPLRALEVLDSAGVHDAGSLYNRGCVLRALDRLEEAASAFDLATRAAPTFLGAWNNLGVTLKEMHRLEAAGVILEDVARRCDESSPAPALGDVAPADVWRNLSNVRMAQGDPEAAIAALQNGLGVDPARSDLASSILLYAACVGRGDPRGGLKGARAWAERYAASEDFVAPPRAAQRRRLRVGYLSADLREHPVGRFVRPILEHHDRGHVEVFVYSDVAKADAQTQRFAALSEHWLDSHGADHEALAEAVRADELDVLVDLGGHSPRNRMPALARRLAPVQLTWLGYVNTTGVDAIDHLVASESLVTPAMESDFSERILRLEGSHWCYAPDEDAPPVAPAPSSREGRVTFGCFNHLAKLSHGTFAAWARILDAVDGARLLLKTHALADPGTCDRIRARLVAAGINPDRVALEPGATLAAYLAAHASMDIALDPFPYSGGTVTCDALWMGVAVVSLEGDTLAGRLGSATLRSIGLDELVCSDVDTYVETAVRLASNPDRIAALRVGMRDRFARSPLGDARAFTRRFEDTLHRVCAR